VISGVNGGESAKKAAFFGKKKQKLLNFALPLPDSIMVVRQILDAPNFIFNFHNHLIPTI
jgi:hypothetical protein